MRHLFLILFSFILSITSIAQSSSDLITDSLLAEIKSSPANTNTAKQFNAQINRIFKLGLPANSNKLLQCLNYTVQVAEEFGNTEELAQGHYNLGKYFISTNLGYSNAITPLLTSLTLYDTMHDSIGVSKCYMQLGLIGYLTQYYEDGIKNFKMSLKYANNATSTYLMAIAYTELEDFEEATKQFLIAKKAFKQQNDTKSLIECYMYLGKLFLDENKMDSAYHFGDIEILVEIDDVIRSKKLIQDFLSDE